MQSLLLQWVQINWVFLQLYFWACTFNVIYLTCWLIIHKLKYPALQHKNDTIHNTVRWHSLKQFNILVILHSSVVSFVVYCMYCMCALPCVNSWPLSGVVVPGALVDDRCLQASLALLEFPCTPQALVKSEQGLHRAWLKDAPLISLVRESVNSLWMTSSGPANQLPSVITLQCVHWSRLISRQQRKT